MQARSRQGMLTFSQLPRASPGGTGRHSSSMPWLLRFASLQKSRVSTDGHLELLRTLTKTTTKPARTRLMPMPASLIASPSNAEFSIPITAYSLDECSPAELFCLSASSSRAARKWTVQAYQVLPYWSGVT
jgi:hypothetical protein